MQLESTIPVSGSSPYAAAAMAASRAWPSASSRSPMITHTRLGRRFEAQRECHAHADGRPWPSDRSPPPGQGSAPCPGAPGDHALERLELVPISLPGDQPELDVQESPRTAPARCPLAEHEAITIR